MCNWQKVIKGLECCTSQDGLHYSFCEVCPYRDNQEKHCGNTQHLMEDALALLKAQKPMVIPVEEVYKTKTILFVEDGISGEMYIFNPSLSDQFNLFMCYKSGEVIYRAEPLEETDYNKKWRCWNLCPTEEQRKAVKWG